MAWRSLASVLAVSALTLAACSADQDSAISTSSPPAITAPAAVSTSSTASASPTDPEAAAVLRQYNAYWPAVVEASTLSVGKIEDYLDDYATGASLERNYGGLVALKRRGRVLYGQAVTRPEVVSIKGAVATVKDCQDGSDDGQMDLKTGKKITKGRPRTPVMATLQRGPGSVWRVSTVTFPGGNC